MGEYPTSCGLHIAHVHKKITVDQAISQTRPSFFLTVHLFASSFRLVVFCCLLYLYDFEIIIARYRKAWERGNEAMLSVYQATGNNRVGV